MIVCKTSPVKTKHYHLQMLYLSILAVKQEKLTVDHLSTQVSFTQELGRDRVG